MPPPSVTSGLGSGGVGGSAMATERLGGPLARGIEPTESGEDTGR
jgi:hypothetical protein